ncbi:fatty acid desaturase, type 1 protein [Tanacetum coccineum]
MGASDEMKLFKRVPISNPPFDYNDLKRAIPPHCFTKSLNRSLYILSHDIIVICFFYYLASNYIHILPEFITYIAWPLYWIFQGLAVGKFWSIGHECHHNTFTGYGLLDNTIGYLIHSSALTPYFSIKFSHHNHHAHTNSLEYDETHIPKRKSDRLYDGIIDNPVGFVFLILFKLIFGVPLYLIINLGGRKYESYTSHFYPQSPLFKDTQRAKVFASDVGVLVFFYAYYQMVIAQGAMWVFKLYGGPWIFMNGILFVLTYLQHNHPSIPHYDSTEWSWIRGALSSVDRDVGFMIVNNKTDNHVVHHLFPAIPSYHAHEATEAIKPILGDYYKYDGTPILKAFWREMKGCLYVESDDYDNDDENKKTNGVYWFRK